MSDTERTEEKNLGTVATIRHSKYTWLEVDTLWFNSEIKPHFHTLPQKGNIAHMECLLSKCKGRVKVIHDENSGMTSYNQYQSHNYTAHNYNGVPIPGKSPIKKQPQSIDTDLKLREDPPQILHDIIEVDLENEDETTFSPYPRLLELVKVEDISLLSPILDGMTTYFSGDPNLKIILPYMITLFNDKAVEFVYKSQSYKELIVNNCMITVYRDPLQVDKTLCNLNGCIISKFHHSNKVLEIKFIGVTAQKSGIGTSLMKTHIDYTLDKHPQYDIVLDSVTGAIQFYQKLGFKKQSSTMTEKILEVIEDPSFESRFSMTVMKLDKAKYKSKK